MALKKMAKTTSLSKASLKNTRKKVAPIKVKKKKVLAIPKGCHSITPYIIVSKAAKAIDFYKKAFGAKELFRMEQSNGKIAHAELKIGDSKIMLGDECPEMKMLSPKMPGESGISIHLYVKDVDAVVKSAVKAGAVLTHPVMDMFYGDRAGMLQDPFNHTWCVATHIEDLTPAKLKKRAAEFYNNNEK